MPRQWLSVNVVHKVNELINQITEKLNAHVHSLHAKLMLDLQSKLEANVIEYFSTERGYFDLNYQAQAKKLERTLTEFRDKGSEQLTFDLFVNDAKSKPFLASSETSELEAKRMQANEFIKILPVANQLIFLSKKHTWIGTQLTNRLNELITELTQYQIELSTAGKFSSRVYTYQHFFVRLSSVMATNAGADGSHGATGMSGNNGGNLIIIGQRFIQFSFLKFVSKGGKGGPGQEGSFKSYLRFVVMGQKNG